MELTPLGTAKLVESIVLWRKAQRRFEQIYGQDRAATLRVALAEIFSDEFPMALTDSADLRKR